MGRLAASLEWVITPVPMAVLFAAFASTTQDERTEASSANFWAAHFYELMIPKVRASHQDPAGGIGNDRVARPVTAAGRSSEKFPPCCAHGSAFGALRFRIEPSGTILSHSLLRPSQRALYAARLRAGLDCTRIPTQFLRAACGTPSLLMGRRWKKMISSDLANL